MTREDIHHAIVAGIAKDFGSRQKGAVQIAVEVVLDAAIAVCKDQIEALEINEQGAQAFGDESYDNASTGAEWCVRALTELKGTPQA